MVCLKDYLGALISDLSQARVLADLESANIARLYASEELLRSFPIPRFRVSDIELNIPIAIAELKSRSTEAYQPFDLATMGSTIYQRMEELAGVNTFEKKIAKLLQEVIGSFTTDLESTLKREGYSMKSIRTFSQTVADFYWNNVVSNTDIRSLLSKRFDANEDGAIKAQLVEQFYNDVHPLIQPETGPNAIEDLKVWATASELKDIKDSNLIQIKMKLNEEGMEWHKIDLENGESKMKLIPE